MAANTKTPLTANEIEEALKFYYVLNQETPDEERGITRAELSLKETYLLRKRAYTAFECNFGKIDPNNWDNSLDIEDIPLIHHSIALKDIPGALCGYIFMSLSEDLFSLAVSDTETFENAIIRTIESEEGERLFFIGFREAADATKFLWTFSWDEDITEDVYFNGHQVVCGSEAWKGYI